MKKFKTSFFLVVITSSFCYADSYVSHSCYQPSIPYQFTSEYEVTNFNSEVDTYKACIEDFIDEQNDAIRNHRDAAEDAIDDWNRFASSI